MIVTDFGEDVQAYLDQFEQLNFPRPAVCLVCQVVGRMIGHGFYPRKALAVAQVYGGPIKRWICAAWLLESADRRRRQIARTRHARH